MSAKVFCLALLLATAKLVPMGDMGSLTIDGRTSVALQHGRGNSECQAICDNEDFAYACTMDDCLYIGDHSTQAFSTLSSVRVGDTATYIDATGEERHLTCTLVDVTGYYEDVAPFIYFSGGQIPYECFDNAVICYTCAYAFEGNRIIVVFE